MIVAHPVVETSLVDGFTLWPVARLTPYGFPHLGDALEPLEVGTAVMSIINCDDENSPTIELTAAELRPLLAGVERDLAGFLRLAAAWTEEHLPDHSVPVTAALARALDMPSPS